jgi:tRNA(fMet)-specific endonuclease VapC
MKYLLDTDICIEAIRQRSEQVVKHCEEHAGEGIGISAITYAELEFGCEKSSSPTKNRRALEKFLCGLVVDDFPVAAGLAYAKIRHALERKGSIIGPNDLLIAAHCLQVGATLVTNNVREFRRLPGLRVVNWLT